MKYLLKEQTARRLEQLIAEGALPDSPIPNQRKATTWNPVLVRCLSATAASGSGVGAQSYSGEVVLINGNDTTQETGADVWLTVLTGVGSAGVPTVNAIYSGLYAGMYDPGSDRRPRVFAVPVGGGGGTLEVEEVDGSPSVSSVTELRFDQADGFVVSTPGAGIARVDLSIPRAGTAGPIISLFSPSADDTWEATGYNVTLPSAGTYLIWLETMSTIEVSAGNLDLSRMFAQIFDNTAGVEIPISGIPYVFANHAAVYDVALVRSAFKLFVYVASGANNLGVQVQRWSGPTWVTSVCDGTIGYLKIPG